MAKKAKAKKKKPGVLIVMKDKTYFLPGKPEDILQEIEGTLVSAGHIGADYLIAPDDIFRFGEEEMRDLLCSPIIIARGRK